jgi:DNA-binding MarR family transcriptional regulator
MTKISYFKAILTMEKMYRLFCEEIVKVELRRLKLDDINNVQCILLYNIGMDTIGDLTFTELKSRGYYLGSNVSYSLGKLIENKYVLQRRSVQDGRVIYLILSEKGKDLFSKLDDIFKDRIKDVIRNDNYNIVANINIIKDFLEELLDVKKEKEDVEPDC